jgi:HEAT repeat protein
MKRAKIAFAVLAVALVGVIVWQAAQPGEREPVYEGKPLSAFLGECFRVAPADSGTGNFLCVGEASQAVRQAGTNAIPVLLRLLRSRDSALKSKVLRLLARQQVVKVHDIPAEVWNELASCGFEALGANAQAAVPELIEIANQNISWESKSSAIESLGYVGPPAKQAVPCLLKWSTNQPSRVSASAKRALVRIDPEAAAKAGIADSP